MRASGVLLRAGRACSPGRPPRAPSRPVSWRATARAATAAARAAADQASGGGGRKRRRRRVERQRRRRQRTREQRVERRQRLQRRHLQRRHLQRQRVEQQRFEQLGGLVHPECQGGLRRDDLRHLPWRGPLRQRGLRHVRRDHVRRDLRPVLRLAQLHVLHLREQQLLRHALLPLLDPQRARGRPAVRAEEGIRWPRHATSSISRLRPRLRRVRRLLHLGQPRHGHRGRDGIDHRHRRRRHGHGRRHGTGGAAGTGRGRRRDERRRPGLQLRAQPRLLQLGAERSQRGAARSHRRHRLPPPQAHRGLPRPEGQHHPRARAHGDGPGGRAGHRLQHHRPVGRALHRAERRRHGALLAAEPPAAHLHRHGRRQPRQLLGGVRADAGDHLLALHPHLGGVERARSGGRQLAGDPDLGHHAAQAERSRLVERHHLRVHPPAPRHLRGRPQARPAGQGHAGRDRLPRASSTPSCVTRTSRRPARSTPTTPRRAARTSTW